MQKKSIDTISLLFDALALAGGALLTLAFAPFHFYFLAILSPAILLLAIKSGSLKRIAWRGWLFGLGFFGTGASWVFVSIHLYGPAPIPLALLLTFLFVAALACYFSALTLLFKKFFPHTSLTSYLVAFPAMWLLFEALRGYLFTGFSWLFLGYSQTNSPLATFIPVIGTYGLSFLLVLTGGCIAFAIEMRKQVFYVLLPMIAMLALFCVGSIANSYEWTNRKGDILRVALVQGNIPQTQKWDPQFIHNIMNRYADLTQSEWQNDIIVWPEAAVPIPLPYANHWLTQLAKQARQHDAVMIVGAISENAQGQYYNSMVSLGRNNDIYDKRKLVPFGEFVPFESYLRGIIKFFDLPMSHMDSGNSQDASILHAGALAVLPMICYEVAYVDQLRDAKDSDILVTISNDGWFGNSIGPHQHLQIAQARALESGRYVLRATNSGITAIINPFGEVVSQIPQFEPSVLRGEAFAMEGETPFMKIGYAKLLWFATVLLLGSLVVTANHRRFVKFISSARDVQD
jgi:apolipoprotein N-acyltransferase